LDLDNFKRVNDTLGHDIGDSLLREVAGRLKKCVRKEDTVARPGGDEFTILLNEIGTPSDAGMVAEKILNHLREPITISGHPLVVTTSIGITLLPGDGIEPNLLTRNADLAMYQAKERGRNNYQFYSDDLNTNAVTRLRTEYEIRQALEREEFRLVYQPKVSLKTQEIIGVECLIRWDHPERGALGPIEFIEVAEETGTIIDIGNWVIEEACKAAQLINEERATPIHIAVNISPRQFRDPNFSATIRRCIREMQMIPSQLELEITETMLMHDVEAAEETIKHLCDLGVQLAIDDFGTGYSSLSYLKRFPINTVKVDKSFVMDIPENQDDMAITAAVIAMAHQLKMEVVAEGVQTREQLEFLLEHKCEYAQGYLFSRPLALNDMRQLLDENIRIMRVE
jgi:diguanylate cyclase (GGDEF)-like protein